MEPTPTRYDLRWRMFGTDVRVHPMFWLVSVIMGARLAEQGVLELAIWIVCVFVSILIHELGHVWMGQIFGTRGHIVLYGFGGLAVGSNQLDGRWQRMAVCFAGPLAGFAFLGVLLFALWWWDASSFPFYVLLMQLNLGLPLDPLLDMEVMPTLPHPILFSAVSHLIFINLLWGLVNLLPVWPLDGGQISRDGCEGIWRERGLLISLGISLTVAGLLALHCLMAIIDRPLIPINIGSGYSMILFAALAVHSYQLYQQALVKQDRWRDSSWDDDYTDR
jgi:Zn-dependent protease